MSALAHRTLHYMRVTSEQICTLGLTEVARLQCPGQGQNNREWSSHPLCLFKVLAAVAHAYKHLAQSNGTGMRGHIP